MILARMIQLKVPVAIFVSIVLSVCLASIQVQAFPTVISFGSCHSHSSASYEYKYQSKYQQSEALLQLPHHRMFHKDTDKKQSIGSTGRSTTTSLFATQSTGASTGAGAQQQQQQQQQQAPSHIHTMLKLKQDKEYSKEQLKAALDSLLADSDNPSFDSRHIFGYGYGVEDHQLSMLQTITATVLLDYQEYMVRSIKKHELPVPDACVAIAYSIHAIDNR